MQQEEHSSATSLGRTTETPRRFGNREVNMPNWKKYACWVDGIKKYDYKSFHVMSSSSQLTSYFQTSFQFQVISINEMSQKRVHLQVRAGAPTAARGGGGVGATPGGARGGAGGRWDQRSDGTVRLVKFSQTDLVDECYDI